MKSYKDNRLLMGLLMLGIAAGVTGRFFETERMSFPSQGNLNQAAAILATRENIVGAPSATPNPAKSLGVSDSMKTETDVSFVRQEDCGGEMAIKAKDSRTVGFLCLSAKDPAADAVIAEASTKVNALVVSFNYGTGMLRTDQEKVAERAIDAGAAMVVGFGPKPSAEASSYKGVPIVYSLGEPATKANPRPKRISVTALLTGKTVTDILIR